jgi:ubiquinone/menaquinone biosynthesis C-methylase UbiE
MKKIGMRKIELVFWILLWMVLATFGQEKRIPVESWERRLNQVQPPEKIMDAIGLKPGMTIGDIGAGRGRFAVWFADRVGPEGKVYANDIDEDALAHLVRRCKQHDITNVETILGEIEDPLLPEKSLDIAFMINVYHHLDKPVELVRNIRPSLKYDGILAIVDADPEKSGLNDHHSTPKNDMSKQLDKAGYRVIRIEDFLQLDYIYICRPK